MKKLLLLLVLSPCFYALGMQEQAIEQPQPVRKNPPSLKLLSQIQVIRNLATQKRGWSPTLSRIPQEVCHFILKGLFFAMARTQGIDIRIRWIETCSCLYGLTGKDFSVRDRCTIFLNILIAPKLTKEQKLNFITGYKQGLSMLCRSINQKKLQEYTTLELPILEQVEQLLKNEAVINICYNWVVHSGYVSKRAPVDPRSEVYVYRQFEFKEDAQLVSKYTFDTELCTYVLDWQNLWLLQILHEEFGMPLNYSGKALWDPLGKIPSRVPVADDGYRFREKSSLELALHTLNADIVAYILKFVQIPEILTQTHNQPIEVVDSLAHRLLQILSAKLSSINLRNRAEDGTYYKTMLLPKTPEDALSDFFKVLDVLLAHGLNIQCVERNKNNLKKTMMEHITDVPCEDEIQVKLIKGLLQRGTPYLSKKSLSDLVAFVNSNLEFSFHPLPTVLSAWVDFCGSLKNIPAEFDDLKILIAIIIDDRAYLEEHRESNLLDQRVFDIPYLHYIVRLGRMEILKFFLQKSETKNLALRDVQGNVPLHCAVGVVNVAMVSFLIDLMKQGYDIGINKREYDAYYSRTPLDLALYHLNKYNSVNRPVPTQRELDLKKIIQMLQEHGGLRNLEKLERDADSDDSTDESNDSDAGDTQGTDSDSDVGSNSDATNSEDHNQNDKHQDNQEVP